MLHDTVDCQLQDLSSQFYLTEKDVGSNRAVACQEKLQELNTSVSVSASSSELSEGFLAQFQVISCTRHQALKEDTSRSCSMRLVSCSTLSAITCSCQEVV